MCKQDDEPVTGQPHDGISPRPLRLRGPLAALLGSSVVIACMFHPLDGLAYVTFGTVMILSIYGVFFAAIRGLLRISANESSATILVILGRLCIWASLVALFCWALTLPQRHWHMYQNRVGCRFRLSRLGGAMRAYHEFYGAPIPRCTRDEDGRTLHSWRVLLLPFLDEQRVYDELRLVNHGIARTIVRCLVSMFEWQRISAVRDR